MERQRNEPGSLQLPAWMLTLSLLPFIATVAAGLIGFMEKLPIGMRFDEITPPIMASIRTPWVLINLFIGLAVLNGSLAGIGLAYAVRKTQARPWLIAALGANLLALAVAIIGMMLRISVISFDEATLGENGVFRFVSTLGYIGNPLIFLATFFLSVGLAVSGLLRKIGIVVGVIGGLLFLLSYFPAASDKMPPFVIAFLWMPIGIALLLKQRQETPALEVALPGS
jgi:hypothetical protein